MPTVRPFRALRYDATAVPDLADVLCPPYDIIPADEQSGLLARDPHNAIRLELPSDPDPTDPQARYKAAARTLAEWRTDGTLRKDKQPSLYIHEMRYPTPGGHGERVSRGLMGRVKLEPLDAGGGVRRHERTMSGPKEDRFRLLKATGMNTSPIVLLHQQDVSDAVERAAAGEPDAEAVDSMDVRHRLWVRPTTLDDDLLERLGAGPMTIADGHHRYETALRYQEERGRNRACESDPPFDYVLALLYHVDEAPAVLATHRVIRGVADAGSLLRGADALFSVERVADAAELLARMASPESDVERGRFGLWTPDGGAVLHVRRDQMEPLLPRDVPEVARWIDAAVLATALGELADIGADDLVGGQRVTYVKDAAEAVAMVDRGDGDAALLLDPTPVASVLEVAAAGGTMPQKSTYFHPKAPTGLLFNPLEP